MFSLLTKNMINVKSYLHFPVCFLLHQDGEYPCNLYLEHSGVLESHHHHQQLLGTISGFFSFLKVLPVITDAVTCSIFSAFLIDGMTDAFYNPTPQSSRWCLPFLILYMTWYFFSVSH